MGRTNSTSDQKNTKSKTAIFKHLQL